MKSSLLIIGCLFAFGVKAECGEILKFKFSYYDTVCSKSGSCSNVDGPTFESQQLEMLDADTTEVLLLQRVAQKKDLRSAEVGYASLYDSSPAKYSIKLVKFKTPVGDNYIVEMSIFCGKGFGQKIDLISHVSSTWVSEKPLSLNSFVPYEEGDYKIFPKILITPQP